MDIVGLAHERQRTHGDAIMLCVGQPAAVLPDSVARAAANADHGYTPVAGLPELRERIARWHRETYGVDTRADNVVVTTGSSGGLVALFVACLSAGDHIAITDPGYPAYRNTAKALDVAVDIVPVGPEDHYQPSPELFERFAPQARAAIVTSPANPTGTIIAPEQLGRLCRWAEEKDVWLISDEIYHGLSFGPETATARSFSQSAIVVGSMSKYFTMTGWRVGWLILPDELVEPVKNVQGNLALCPPAVGQYAALAAFDDTASFDELAARYATNLEVALPALEKMGFSVPVAPDGSFYIWADGAQLTNDSQKFCADLLDATGVALAPGVDFSASRTHVRLSLCGRTEDLVAALERMQEWIKNS
ncbi:pyridoxal phosphate-dependent aminotransferase [Corynebacterium aquilae]|nr:aminotransferase class I/II-fold pyridoxal phosphate-dependent enzyme [Corynebacterium aquilae]